MSEKMKPNEGQPLEATMKVLKGKIKDEEITNFVNTIVSAKAAKPILATASLAMGLVFSIVHCEPKEKRWVFNEEIWGIGVAGITSVGLMYTAYGKWETFFKETTAFHVQGVSDGAGLLQITWFNSKGIPIGQFNGPAGERLYLKQVEAVTGNRNNDQKCSETVASNKSLFFRFSPRDRFLKSPD